MPLVRVENLNKEFPQVWNSIKVRMQKQMSKLLITVAIG
jgi:hypothetical protein